MHKEDLQTLRDGTILVQIHTGIDYIILKKDNGVQYTTYYIVNYDTYLTEDYDDAIVIVPEYDIQDNFIIKQDSTTKIEDKVNHPSHYTWLKDFCGIEVIDITRHLTNDIGNVVKYCLRAGHKSEEGLSSKEKKIQDLEKAVFYLKDEIERIKKWE